jgi:hypothetical protein
MRAVEWVDEARQGEHKKSVNVKKATSVNGVSFEFSNRSFWGSSLIPGHLWLGPRQQVCEGLVEWSERQTQYNISKTTKDDEITQKKVELKYIL